MRSGNPDTHFAECKVHFRNPDTGFADRKMRLRHSAWEETASLLRKTQIWGAGDARFHAGGIQEQASPTMVWG